MSAISSSIYSDACLVFIITGIICSVIRYCHMCKPYDKEEDYFYPARKQVSLAYLSISLLMIPYWINPANDAYMLAAQITGVVFYPLCFSMLFHKYFNGHNDKPSKLLRTGQIATCLAVLATVFFAVLLPEKALACKNGLMAIAGVLSIILSIRLFKLLNWIRGKIENFHLQNFSNKDDFPYKFAEKVILLPAVWIMMEWAIFFSGSRELKAVFDIVFSIAMVALLCAILHPQRVHSPSSAKKEIELFRDEEEQFLSQAADFEEDETECQCSTAAIDEEARKRVLEIIGRRFKEPHLTKRDVLADIERGKVHQANLYIRSIGYYTLINMFRLEYARQYSDANPKLKQAVIAQAAGFASGSSFSKAKKSVDHIDPDLVKYISIQ